DAGEVRLRIERRLGIPLDVRGVEVAISRSPDGFVATIDMRGVTLANQNRTLTSAACDDLADAVAVVVARLANENRPVRVAALDGAISTTEVADPVVAAPPSRRTWGAGLRGLGVSGVGAQPKVGIGGELAMFVRYQHYFGELAGARWRKTSAYLSPGAPGGVDVGLEMLAARGGWSPEDKPIRAWLGVEVGQLVGEGIALVDPRVGSGRWIAAAAGFGVAWPIARHVRLIGTIELAVPFGQPTFTLTTGSEIYQSSPASARSAVGFEVGWP
ncbi:MAG TPA: hypothetical protein VIU61_06060, partial [Kofleriaceae bacterium]